MSNSASEPGAIDLQIAGLNAFHFRSKSVA